MNKKFVGMISLVMIILAVTIFSSSRLFDGLTKEKASPEEIKLAFGDSQVEVREVEEVRAGCKMIEAKVENNVVTRFVGEGCSK